MFYIMNPYSAKHYMSTTSDKCTTKPALKLHFLRVFASSLLGFVVFGEPLPLLWWMGISFMLVGVSLVVTEKDAPTDEAKHSYE